jgi:uncharacterized protein (TIGR00730 family)
MREIRRVCVYCASSRQADQAYADAAGRLGGLLAREGATVVYGGAAIGSMRALADGALAGGGRVVGVLPRFMYDMELAHPGISELVLVDDLHERKRKMIDEVDAVVALPGGTGTFEELMEAITWKRLGLFLNPIVIVNQSGFYDSLLAQFQRSVDGRFMDERHLAMWTAVDDVDAVLGAIKESPGWSEDARAFAAP